MRFDILTLLPEVFPEYLGASIVSKAQRAGLLEVFVHNIRDFTTDKHHITDEPPYGGGGGMILKPEPIFSGVEWLLGSNVNDKQNLSDQSERSIILLSPQGRVFNQTAAEELSKRKRIILICGRYEGVDERVRQHLITDEISIGDYVLTGGELAALVVVDAVSRLLPGSLGAEGAADSDSHATGILEGPHYTRPEVFRDWSVPDVLRSGHAARIKRWRRDQALRRTWKRRPELLISAVLDEEDKRFLATLAAEND